MQDDIQCYLDILKDDDHKFSTFSFANNTACQTPDQEPDTHQIQNTIDDINDLLSNLYEESEDNQGITQVEEQDEEDEKNEEEEVQQKQQEQQEQEEQQEEQEEQDEYNNILIQSLENATQNIVTGIQALLQKKENIQPKKMKFADRMEQRQREKEQKIKRLRQEKEQIERKKLNSTRVLKNKKNTLHNQVPIHQRVNQILDNKKKWVNNEQKKKEKKEEQYYESLPFKPKVNTSGNQSEYSTEQFIESQKEWLQKKNDALIVMKLEQEKKTAQYLTFKPQLSSKSGNKKANSVESEYA